MVVRRGRDLDESDVRIRPNRRGSRPRTKERPRHADAVPARVIAVDRGRWTTLVDAGTPHERAVRAMRARELGRTSIVPGDMVALTGDISGCDGSLARIVRRENRSSFLRRSADDDDATERPLVANVDQMVVVTALADPQPRPRLIDRCLVAAYDAGIEPLLCLTKADLCPPMGFLDRYAPLGVPYVTTSLDPSGSICGLEALRERLAGRTSVLVGHSGVGKSTIVNALVPGTDRAIGDVNDVTGRGRHTSTSALALRLPEVDGWVIDTPGVRSFGLGHVESERLLNAFQDLAQCADACPRDCSHLATAPDCALDGAVAQGLAGPAGASRLDSYRRLVETLRRNDPWDM
ncbi:ribosome small subunit-dependent GTPase A [Devriesea agamarum]|uniref:ribosome small subunit-dependent GTPase A n=1 Tax=Devriesea agamarum TaxID=472569 RepID=UPI00071C34E2|nr:ribosome small subunit-dependent GTPase A [Devriesea agamarum]